MDSCNDSLSQDESPSAMDAEKVPLYPQRTLLKTPKWYVECTENIVQDITITTGDDPTIQEEMYDCV